MIGWHELELRPTGASNVSSIPIQPMAVFERQRHRHLFRTLASLGKPHSRSSAILGNKFYAGPFKCFDNGDNRFIRYLDWPTSFCAL
jgi:hypothetical protein